MNRNRVRIRRRLDADGKPTVGWHFEVGNDDDGFIEVPTSGVTVELDPERLSVAVVRFLDPEVQLAPYLPGQQAEPVDLAVIVAGHQVLVPTPADASPRWVAVAAAKYAVFSTDDGAFIDNAELRDRDGELLTEGRADQFAQPLYLDPPAGAGG